MAVMAEDVSGPWDAGMRGVTVPESVVVGEREDVDGEEGERVEAKVVWGRVVVEHDRRSP